MSHQENEVTQKNAVKIFVGSSITQDVSLVTSADLIMTEHRIAISKKNVGEQTAGFLIKVQSFIFYREVRPLLQKREAPETVIKIPFRCKE